MNLVDVAFVVAMECEAECVTANMEFAIETRRYGRRTVCGFIGDRVIALVVSGVGRDNAAAATQLAIAEFHPCEVVNIGLAGAMDGRIKVGQICAVRRAVEYDFDLSKVNNTDVGVLNERKDRYIPCIVRNMEGFTLATGDRFSDSDNDARFLASIGASLRDMEGAAVAHVCETAGVSCSVWKCVSDVYGHGSMIEQYNRNSKYALGVLCKSVHALLVDAPCNLMNGHEFAHRHGDDVLVTKHKQNRGERAMKRLTKKVVTNVKTSPKKTTTNKTAQKTVAKAKKTTAKKCAKRK